MPEDYGRGWEKHLLVGPVGERKAIRAEVEDIHVALAVYRGEPAKRGCSERQ